MSESPKERKEKLEKEFEEIQNQHDIDPNDFLVKSDDLPEFGSIELYNYDDDILDVEKTASQVLDNLVNLYLGDLPEVKNHPYIKNKKVEDANDYADAKFLSRMSRKLFIQQLKQIDNGDNQARMYEVANQTMRELRENVKDSRQSRVEIERFYKELRTDLGLNEMGQNNIDVNDDENTDGDVIDTQELNNKIDQIIKSKERGK